MAKDFVSSLGGAELNALMSMQLQKMNDVIIRLNKLFDENGMKDINQAYANNVDAQFVNARDAMLDELNAIADTMDKVRQAQKAL